MNAISSISKISNISPAFGTPTSNAAIATAQSSGTSAQNPSSSTPSSVVTLGLANATTQTQGWYGTAVQAAAPLVWKNKPSDGISALMASNFSLQTPAGRFSGLGAALLKQFSSNGSAISQSVQQGAPRVPPNASGIATAAAPLLPGTADNQVAFTVTTQAGTHIKLALDDTQDGLAVQIKSDGKLSDAERSALDQLAAGLQDALNGAAADPPQIKLDGLTQFDPTVLASVDLHATIKSSSANSATPQSLDFHADAAQRTVSFNGQTGAATVSVDLSNATGWGDQQQQAKAIASYQQQFDQADSRGHGDASLMAMFKDAFAEMNSHYPATAPRQTAGALPLILQDQDHAVLTGLADFSASIAQTPVASNPALLDQKDGFAYQVSQNTNITGPSQASRSISQTQQSSLQASYHRPISADAPLMLSTARASQNYYYDQVDDTASSAAGLSYKKGTLVKASLDQSASQSTHVLKYTEGNVAEDTTTPLQASLSQDLVDALAQKRKADQAETAVEIYQRKQKLSAINDSIFLQANPTALREAQA